MSLTTASVTTNATGQADQQRLCLIIGMVRGEHGHRARFPGAGIQCPIAMLASPSLHRLAPRRTAIKPPQVEGHTEPVRGARTVRGERVGCRLQTVMHVTGNKTFRRNRRYAGMKQSSGICAAACSNHQPRISGQRGKRLTDCLNDRIVGGHQATRAQLAPSSLNLP